MPVSRRPLRSTLLFVALDLGVLFSPLTAADKPLPPINAEERGAIESALSAKARVKPAKPRKLLIFHRTEGYVHSSIPVANEAIKRLGEVTGAYAGVTSDDMAMFDANTLNTFDGVIFVSTTSLKFENPAHREALLAFVAAGKGVMGLHAATDNFPRWPEGQALMGGVFHGHPWNAGNTVAVKLDEPDHIINTAFERRGFWVKDEIYQFRAPYGRDRLRVLMSLDMSRPENARPADKIHRTDNDFAISWIKNAGPGRVFYSSLGHNKDIFYVPSILQHFLDGIQFALGDLPADAVPSASLPQPPHPALASDDKSTLQDLAARQRIAASPIDDKTYAEFAASDGVKPPVALGVLENVLRARSPGARIQEEARLLALLNAPATTLFAKQSALRILGWAGSAASVPVIEKQASADHLAQPAASALASIADPAAEAALVRLASSGPDATRIPAVNALGVRRATSSKALAALRRAAVDQHPAVAHAALEALASIDTPKAFSALQSLPRKGADEEILTQALLNAADRIVRKPGSSTSLISDAAKVARKILATSKITPLRAEAARLVLVADGPKAVSLLLPLTRDGEAVIRQSVTHSLLRSRYPDALQSLLDGFGTLETDTRHTILSIAEETGSPALRPFALAALTSPDEATRSLAIIAAGRTGDETTIDVLLPLLDSGDETGKAAQLALGYLPTGAVDTTLRARLETAATPRTKATLLKIIADRQDREIFNRALALTLHDDKDLRGAAFEAVSKLVRPGDLATIIPLASAVKTGGDRRDWQKALFNTSGIHPDANDAVKRLQAAISESGGPERPILIGALTTIAGDPSAQALRSFLSSDKPDTRKEVIRALSAARTKGAFTLLLETAGKATEPAERILALRGYLDTVDSQQLKDDKRVGAYRAAWPLAARTEEKDAIIAAVKRINKDNKEVKKFLSEFAPEEASATSNT